MSASGSQISMSMPLRTPHSLPAFGAMAGWPPICASNGPRLAFSSIQHILLRGAGCTSRARSCLYSPTAKPPPPCCCA